MPGSKVQQVIVIGAGVAGLAAARALAEAGLQVLVLEARDRTGGRILTLYLDQAAVPVELGAEFLHGQPPELMALLAEAGLATYEVEGEQVCFEGGQLGACRADEAFTVLEGMTAEDDIPFDAYLAKSDAPDAAKARARQYVEGFNAADAARIGTAGLARQQAAEDAIEGDRAWRVTAGYGALIRGMVTRATEAGAAIRLNSPVAAVRWQPGQVSVKLAAGVELLARQVIVTLPLGVLQADSVVFDPIPACFSGLDRLAMGPVQRLVLVFRERFWAESMSFLFARDQTPGVWWTSSPRSSTVLTGWIGGPRSLAVPSAEEWLARSLASLEQMYALTPGSLTGELLSWRLHDWQADPYSRGAYSYALVGGLAASAALAQPVAQTLFFAGEHTDTTGHPGTVHGALHSGQRAAAQLLAGLPKEPPTQ